MKYDPLKHHRRSIRLKGYDYSSPGAYFVTICVERREHRLGEIVDGVMRLNDAGRMVQAAWQALPGRFPNIRLDEFVIMPNHVHGIIVITVTSVGATLGVAPDGVAPADRAGTSPAPPPGRPTLGNIVGAFKSITTDEYIRGVKFAGWPPFVKRIWQRDYWDRILPDERALNIVRRYIQNNPRNWLVDRDNTRNLHRLPPPTQVGDYLSDAGVPLE